jgi:hypothetical protein
MTMKKLLFLDVDGVLNNSESNFNFHPPSLLLLSNIVAKTQCDIVLSSTWRLFQETKNELEAVFIEHNIPKWIDCTPHIRGVDRSEEITNWLLGNVKCECKAIIIDDDQDAKVTKKLDLIEILFIRTNVDKGLVADEARQIVEFFIVP